MRRQGGGAFTAIAEGTRGLGAQLLEIAARNQAEEQAEAERAERRAMHEASLAVQREGMEATMAGQGMFRNIVPMKERPTPDPAAEPKVLPEGVEDERPTGPGAALLEQMKPRMQGLTRQEGWGYDPERDPNERRAGTQREFVTSERLGTEGFTRGESALDRANRLALADKENAGRLGAARISASASASRTPAVSPDTRSAAGVVQRYVVDGYDIDSAIAEARRLYPGADFGALNAAAAEARALEAQTGQRQRSNQPTARDELIRQMLGGDEPTPAASARPRVPGAGPTQAAAGALEQRRAEWDQLAERARARGLDPVEAIGRPRP